MSAIQGTQGGSSTLVLFGCDGVRVLHVGVTLDGVNIIHRVVNPLPAYTFELFTDQEEIIV